MMGLRELLACPRGRERLDRAGIFTDPAAFLAALPPGRQAIYTHQQPGPDIRRSVLAKLTALDGLRRARPDAVDAVFVRIDTDRAASSKAATRIGWEDAAGRRHMLKVTPPGSDALEFRHLALDPGRLAAIAATLAAYLRQMPGDRARAAARLATLQPLLAPAAPPTLGRYGAAIGDFLLDAQYGIRLRSTMVSDLADGGALAPGLETLMAGLDGFVAAFNRAVADVRADGIDPAVGPLPDDYLPLFYSCPVDGERIRLRRQPVGSDLHAVAESRAGRRYGFPLGPRGALDTLFAAGRWSPDVTLPVLLNGSFGGMAAGRSSALYSLVLGQAMRDALGVRPIPILVPAALAADQPGPDGLLQTWLTR